MKLIQGGKPPEPKGLDKILANESPLFGVPQATYELWRSTARDPQPLTFAGLCKGVRNALGQQHLCVAGEPPKPLGDL